MALTSFGRTKCRERERNQRKRKELPIAATEKTKNKGNWENLNNNDCSSIGDCHSIDKILQKKGTIKEESFAGFL